MNLGIRRFLFSSLSIWAALGIYGIYFIFHIKENINFGIDLVGGTYITLEVQMDKVIEKELADRLTALFKKMSAERKITPSNKATAAQAVTLTFASATDASYVAASSLIQEFRLTVTRSGEQLTFALAEEEMKTLTHDAVAGNISVLRSRIDQFGVGEVTIAAHGDKQIVVELPQVQDPQKAKAMIGTSALLEVKPVIAVGESPEAILAQRGSKLTDDMVIVPHREKGHGYYLVPRYADLTGRLLKDTWANATGGELGIEPVVHFVFTSEGGDKFYELTNRGPQALIAILVDNVVVTAASAQRPLHSEGYIHGKFSIEYAQNLAKLLKSGAFVAPVVFVQDRTIGPSLGAESIRSGLLACVVGMSLLLLFSIIIYRLAGFLAFLVLLFNLLLIMFAMAAIGATLTLPGIAGMVLTLGMAIDSSVLIYERMREELAAGHGLHLAVKSGFSGALGVILDANITTFLAAAVLYKIGSGPIQGFAVTMMIGIISTLMTGLWLLKSIYGYLLEGVGIRKLNI